MQWSQLKHRIEEQFAPALGGRLQIHYTVYRNLTEGDGRAWLTWDKEELFSRADMPSREKLGAPFTPDAEFYDSARNLLGVLHDYLRTPFADLLASPEPLVRALAIADRRLGRRRFEKLTAHDIAPPLARRVYVLRAEAEGWPTHA
jgi:hypothetical protein